MDNKSFNRLQNAICQHDVNDFFRIILRTLSSTAIARARQYDLSKNHSALTAEDIVQTAFIRLFQYVVRYGMERFKTFSRQHFKDFVLKIVRHECLRHLSNEKYQVIEYEMEIDQTISMSNPYTNPFLPPVEDLEAMISRLPEKQQAVVRLTLENKKQKEIAERLGLTVDNVKYHFSKAKTSLGRQRKSAKTKRSGVP